MVFSEPAYATRARLAAVRRAGADGPARRGRRVRRRAYYFRLTTRPIDQAPFEAALARVGEERLREQVLAGGYRLHVASELESAGAPVVHLAASGAVLPEVLAAAAELADEGVAAHVVDVTSAWTGSTPAGGARCSRTTAAPPARGGRACSRSCSRAGAPIVTVHDAASHAMAWLGSAVGAPCVPLGVDSLASPGRSRTCTSCTTCCPARSSTRRWPRCRFDVGTGMD